jgi:hypothetical protein
VELGRAGIRNGRADQLVNPALDGQQEVPSRERDREERGIEAGERLGAGEDAEGVDDLIDLEAGGLGGAPDQLQQVLVRVRLAEQIDRLAREDLPGEISAVLLREVIAEAREDDAVQGPDLTGLIRPGAEVEERSIGLGSSGTVSRRLGFAAERPGPVAQPVFKTGEAAQPVAG